MTAYLASLLAKKLQPLSFLQIIGGLVTELTYEDVIQDPETMQPARTVRRVVPITNLVYAKDAECVGEPGALRMIPDGSYYGLSYFEDRGSANITQSRGRYNFTSSLRLVVWLNNQMLDMDPILLQSTAQIKILNAWGSNISDEYINNLIFTSRVIVPQHARIFAPYTYDEPKTQYLLLPFVYFAIDFTAQYSVGENCFNNIAKKDPACI